VSWQRVAALAWLAVLLVIAGRVLLRPGKQSVYPTYARAAACWRLGEPVYCLTDLDKVSCNAFRYSPLSAALLVPFGLLPERLGEVLWRLLNAGVLLGAVAGWTRAGLPRRLQPGPRAAVFLLLLPLAVGNLNNGQSNPLVLGLLLLTVTAAARRRWNIAAACMALACLFKIYPVAVGLLLVVVSPRRFAGRLLLFLALGLGIPFLLQRPAYVAEQYADWFRYLQLDNRHDWAAELGYRDLTLLCRVYLTPLSAGAYTAVQLAAAGGAAALCLAARRAGWGRRRLLTGLLALGCCWMTLFGAATESATYLLLAPSLVWALTETFLVPAPRIRRCAVLGSYALFLVTQLACWFPGAAQRVQALGPQPAAALLLLAALLAGWRRQGQETLIMSCRVDPRTQSA
jgi:hypothetical protein